MRYYRFSIETETQTFYTFDFCGHKKTFWTKKGGLEYGTVADMWALCVGKFGVEDEEGGGLLDIIDVEEVEGHSDWTITEEELLA